MAPLATPVQWRRVPTERRGSVPSSGTTRNGFPPRLPCSMLSKALRDPFLRFSQLGPAMYQTDVWQGEVLVLGSGRLPDQYVEPGTAGRTMGGASSADRGGVYRSGRGLGALGGLTKLSAAFGDKP